MGLLINIYSNPRAEEYVKFGMYLGARAGNKDYKKIS